VCIFIPPCGYTATRTKKGQKEADGEDELPAARHEKPSIEKEMRFFSFAWVLHVGSA
jgi:hypothetical protein